MKRYKLIVSFVIKMEVILIVLFVLVVWLRMLWNKDNVLVGIKIMGIMELMILLE